MKQPQYKAPISVWKKPTFYRDISFVIAIVSSVILIMTWHQQGLVAFITVLIMFIGAILSIIGIFLALEQKNISVLVHHLILMLFLILLPLILLSKQIS